jgi:hypothetical protein
VDPPPTTPPPTAATVRWSEPLGHHWTVARLGRSLPVKVDIRVDRARLMPVDGQPSPTLRADLLDACRRGASVTDSRDLGALHWVGGRRGHWMQVVDTHRLTTGCWRLVVVVNGEPAGSAGLRLVGGHEWRHVHHARYRWARPG